MSKIYIDCGTHLGEGLRKHIEQFSIDQTWKIFTFEANKYTFDLFQDARKKELPEKYKWANWDNIEYYNKAVWIYDGKIDFYCSSSSNIENLRRDPWYNDFMNMHDRMVVDGDLIMSHQGNSVPVDGSSTIIPNHLRTTLHSIGNELQKSLVWDDKIVVECFDLSTWIKNNVKEDDFVLCKIDIEGAEFDVLKKCITDDTLKLIDSLDVEFHHFNDPTFNNDYNFIMNEINRLGINFRIW